MNAQRINLSVSDHEMERLRTAYELFKERSRNLPVSFTGFCTMLLMETVTMIESGTLIMEGVPGMIKRPGRPKNSQEAMPDE